MPLLIQKAHNLHAHLLLMLKMQADHACVDYVFDSCCYHCHNAILPSVVLDIKPRVSEYEALTSCLLDCRTQANTTAPTAPAQQQQKRGMFGRKKVTTPNATSAGDPAIDQPTYANQPRGTQGQGAFSDPAAQQGTGPAGNNYPRQGERKP